MQTPIPVVLFARQQTELFMLPNPEKGRITGTKVTYEELARIAGKRKDWVDNDKTIPLKSNDLDAQDKSLYLETLLCIHAKKTNQGITFTTQGTVTLYSDQSIISKSILSLIISQL